MVEQEAIMHILFTGGGTAGHVNPALAIAGHIKTLHPDAKISYIGAAGKIECDLVPKAGYDFYTIDVAGFQRRISFEAIKKNISAVKKAVVSSAEVKKLLKAINPDLVVGTGGYVCGPVLRAAAKLGIKTAVHEANAYPGVTIKLLAPKVDAVMLVNSDAAKYLNCKNEPIITGNPVRQNILEAGREEARAALGLGDKKTVLSFGGSLGARPLNEAVSELIKENKSKYYHFHATGRAGYDRMMNALKADGVKGLPSTVRITEYIDNMDVMLAAADLVICRGGALTLSEISACGKPAIIIPSPYVAENHQYHNAMSLKNRGAAEVIEEKDLSGEHLKKLINSILFDDEALKQMAENAKKSAITDANNRIYNVISSLLG